MMPPNLTPDQKEQLKMARRSNMRIEETWSLYTMFLSSDKRPADALQLAVEAVSVWADWMDQNEIEPPEIHHPDFAEQMGEQMTKAFSVLKQQNIPISGLLPQVGMGLPSQPDSYRWTLKRKGEDFFRVLEQPPVLLHAVVRPAPDRPGQTEIAENEDGGLKIFPTEELAKRTAEAMGSDWGLGIFFLQPGIPDLAALSNPSTPTEATDQKTENPL